ncbi:hypothetical protein HanIR_Chr12g0566511 [Helianthus annuus]|nr:hypothetical protein HanIR_Chr12g0566511 [Helianthus annuus]
MPKRNLVSWKVQRGTDFTKANDNSWYRDAHYELRCTLLLTKLK